MATKIEGEVGRSRLQMRLRNPPKFALCVADQHPAMSNVMHIYFIAGLHSHTFEQNDLREAHNKLVKLVRDRAFSTESS